MTDEIIEKILSSIILIKNVPIDGEFRTTIIPGIHDSATVELIRTLIGNEKLYKVNQYRAGTNIGSYS